MKTRKYNHHYRLELKIRKKTIALFILGCILGLALFCGLVFVNWAGFGKRAITLPTEEGIAPTSVPVKETRKRLDNTAVCTWYGASEEECLDCPKHFDENGLYYLMSNGERLDDKKFTVAHRTLPFGTRVKFLRDDGDGGGRVVEALVTDRGNLYDFDLSKAVFQRLGKLSEGKITVRWETVQE